MFLPEFSVKGLSMRTGYTFLDVIAKGAYGKVYKVQKQETSQMFALKVISKAQIVAQNCVKQAKEEVRAHLEQLCCFARAINVDLICYLRDLTFLFLGSDTENGWTSSFHSEFYPQMAKQEDIVHMYVSIIIAFKF